MEAQWLGIMRRGLRRGGDSRLLRIQPWHIADGAVQRCGVPPVDPLGRSEFDVLERTRRAATTNELGFEQAVHRLRESIVVTIAIHWATAIDERGSVLIDR